VLPLGNTVCEAGVADNEKSATVTARVTGVWFVRPALSVTVSEAKWVPGVEKLTLPGVWTVLELGVPPGKTQEYAVTVPSGSLPVPENETGWPGLTVTSVAGLVIVAVGGRSLDADSCTKLAIDGTPAEFKTKIM